MAERATPPDDIDAAFGADPQGRKISDRLRALAKGQPDFEVFEDPDGTAYMRGGDLRSGALGTWRVRSVATRNWLTSLYLDKHDTSPSNGGMDEAIAGFCSDAAKLPSRVVNLRVGRDPDTGDCYIDLGNADWTVVKFDVSAGTWDIVPSEKNIVFRRTKAMLPLPEAVHDYGEGVEYLRRFINLAGDDNFDKFVAFLLSCLQPVGPYAGCAVSAKKGSGKSQFLRCSVQLIDPNVVEKNVPPRRDADLMTVAHNRHLLSFDNITFLSNEVQDLLSILSTGGGKQERGFNQQDEVHTINAMRPWATTGIGDYIVQSDTLRRTFLITPPPLDGFYTEDHLGPEFTKYAPMILGHLYTAFAIALKTIKDTKDARADDEAPEKQTSSLADIERLMEAAGPSFGWEPGHFSAILARNETEAAEAVIEGNSPVVNFMETLPNAWEGTASEFLTQMQHYYEVINSRFEPLLPRTPTKMSRALADVTDELRTTKGWLLTKVTNRRWALVKTVETEAHNEADEEPAAPSSSHREDNWWERTDAEDGDAS